VGTKATVKFEQKLSEFPLLFAHSVLFGEPPINGTATLVDLGSGLIAGAGCVHLGDRACEVTAQLGEQQVSLSTVL
jgi:hypothetical protein